MTDELSRSQDAALAHIRRVLIRHFQWRRVDEPEDLAQEVMLRISKKMGQGEDIQDLNAFAHGVAKNVFLESIRSRGRDIPAVTPQGHANEEQLALVNRSKQTTLTAAERRLFDRYFSVVGADKIRLHEKMAADLGISRNALRIRVHRLLKRVRTGVREAEKGGR